MHDRLAAAGIIAPKWLPHYTRWYALGASAFAGLVLVVCVAVRAAAGSAAALVDPWWNAIDWIAPLVVLLSLGLVIGHSHNNNKAKWQAAAWGVAFVLAGVSGGLAAAVFAAHARDASCEGPEVVGVDALCDSAVRIALQFLLVLFLGLGIHSLLAPGTEAALSHTPHFPRAERAIRGLTLFITVCCTPQQCSKAIKEMPLKKQHIYHHVIQLVYEVILLIVAIARSELLSLIAIVVGLCASLGGVLAARFVHTRPRVSLAMITAEIGLNAVAIVVALFVTGIEIANLSCFVTASPEVNTDELQWLMNLFLFALIADTIRLNGAMHGTIEMIELRWAWMDSRVRGVEWVPPPPSPSPSPAPSSAPAADHRKPSPPRTTTTRSVVVLTIFTALLLLATLLVGVLWLLPGLASFNAAVAADCRVDAAEYTSTTCSLEEGDSDTGNTLLLHVTATHKQDTADVYGTGAMTASNCLHWDTSDRTLCTDVVPQCFGKSDQVSPPVDYPIHSHTVCAWDPTTRTVSTYRPWLPVGAIITVGMTGLIALLLLFMEALVVRKWRRDQASQEMSERLLA